jgi:hypothetical protein
MTITELICDDILYDERTSRTYEDMRERYEMITRRLFQEMPSSASLFHSAFTPITVLHLGCAMCVR